MTGKKCGCFLRRIFYQYYFFIHFFLRIGDGMCSKQPLKIHRETMTKYSMRRENVINCICESVWFCASTVLIFFFFHFISYFISFLFDICFALGRLLLSICQFLIFRIERFSLSLFRFNFYFTKCDFISGFFLPCNDLLSL